MCECVRRSSCPVSRCVSHRSKSPTKATRSGLDGQMAGLSRARRQRVFSSKGKRAPPVCTQLLGRGAEVEGAAAEEEEAPGGDPPEVCPPEMAEHCVP